MTFANFFADNLPKDDDSQVILNIGDCLQFSLIESLYEEMGVEKNSIYRFNKKEFKKIKHLSLTLPLNYIIFDEPFLENGVLDFGNVRPIFLSVSLNNINQDGIKLLGDSRNVEILKQYTPIGCRDQYTYDILSEYGIEAFIAGCQTITHPPISGVQKEIDFLFVDAPADLAAYVPSEILAKAVYLEQQYYLNQKQLTDQNFMHELFLKHYKKIASAKMVVTSRLHVATVCLSWGIPVIMAKERIDYRFFWFGKYLPLYALEDFDKIEWSVQSLELPEDIRKMLRENAMGQIKNPKRPPHYEIIHDHYKVNGENHYENFRNVTHNDSFKVACWLRKMDPSSEVKFAFWGVTSCVDEIYQQITDFLPNSKLVKVIDEYNQFSYRGVPSEKKESLTGEDDFITIVIGVNASNCAKQYFKEIGKPSEKFCLLGATFMN